MKGRSPFIVLAKPAGQEQVRHSLQEMAQRAGILEDRIDTRALRRGALRDQAYIKKVIAGVATRSTAMIAGHSNKSYEMGTTRDYVGALEDSMYNLRAEQERVDRNAPAFAQEGPSAEWVQERASRREVDDFMKTQNMEIGDANARKRAAKLMRKQRAEEWRTEAKDQPLAITAAPPQPLRQRTATEPNARAGNTSKKNLQKPTEKEETQKYFSTPPPPASATTLPAQQNVVAFDDMLDPQLREYDQMQKEIQKAALQSLADSVFIHAGEMDANNNDDADFHSDSAEEIDDVDSAMLDNHTSAESAAVSSSAFLVPAQEVELSQITTMSGDDFVHFFCKVNIFQIQVPFDRNDEATLIQRVPSGNSRDKPTSFLYSCKKGCGFSLWSRQDLDDHEVNCTGEPPSTKGFKCQRPGCNKKYKNESTLKSHVADYHDFVATACTQCPGKPEVLYTTKLALKKHRDEVHSGVIEEQFCPLKDNCHSEIKYTAKKPLKQHLRRQHHVTTEEMKEYVPDGRKGHSNNKGKKRKPEGWHMGAGNVEEDMQEDEIEG